MSASLRAVLLSLIAALAPLPGCTGVGVMGPAVGEEAVNDEGATDAGVETRPVDEPGSDAAVDQGDGGLAEEGEEAGPTGDAAVVEEAGPEPEFDAAPPEEEDAGPVCTYPAGPYEAALGGTIAPMGWPSAVAVGDETGGADFQSFHCDPEVRSIFLYVGNTW